MDEQQEGQLEGTVDPDPVATIEVPHHGIDGVSDAVFKHLIEVFPVQGYETSFESLNDNQVLRFQVHRKPGEPLPFECRDCSAHHSGEVHVRTSIAVGGRDFPIAVTAGTSLTRDREG